MIQSIPATTLASIRKLLGHRARDRDLFRSFDVAPSGVLLERPQDPVLMLDLGRYPDWREYHRRMGTDPAVEGPSGKILRRLRKEPIRLDDAPAGTPAARILGDYGRWLWGMLEGQHGKLITRGVNAYNWGHAPLQLIPRTRASWQGRQVWVPVDTTASHDSYTHAVEPEHVRWTALDANDRRGLVFRSSWQTEMIEYTPDAVDAGWLVPRINAQHTTSDPYGRGLYSVAWLIWSLLWEVRQRSTEAVERGLGAFQLSKKLRGGETAQEWLEDNKADIEEVIEFFSSTGWLLNIGDWTVDTLKIDTVVEDVVKLEDHLSQQLTRLITGVTLTSTMEGSQGSRAATEVHDQIEAGTACDIAAQTIEPMVGDLVVASLLINGLASDIDPSDLPRARSAIHARTSTDALRTWIDLGGGLLAQETAEALNIAGLVDPDQELLSGRVQSGFPPGLGAPGGFDDRTATRAGLMELARMLGTPGDPQARAAPPETGESHAKLEREALDGVVESVDPDARAKQADLTLRQYLERTPNPKAPRRLSET